MKKWSKKGIAVSLAAVLAAGALAGCGSSEKPAGSSGKLTEITLNEVAHSVECADNSSIENL